MNTLCTGRLSAILFFFAALALDTSAWCALKLPRRLSPDERERIVKIVGFGLSPGFNNYFYPLGGFEGAEVSLEYHTVDTREVGSMGQKTATQQVTSITNVSISKGMFNNIDLTFSFNPALQEENLRSYVAMGRWMSDVDSRWPVSWGGQLFAHGLQVQNTANFRNVGADLFAAYYYKKYSAQFGAGVARSIARFNGGDVSITDSADTEQSDVIDFRWFAGVGGREGKLVWGIDVYQYEAISISTRLGYRF